MAAAGEELGEDGVPVGLQHGADLVRHQHRAVDLVGRIGEVLHQRLVALGPGALVADGEVVARLHGGTLLADLGANAENVVCDVHVVDHGPLIRVLRHQVLAEEAQRVERGRGGKADGEGVEIVQHLAPGAVDRTVAFVGDDEVEALDGDRGVVANEPFGVGCGLFEGGGFLGFLVQLLSSQN